MADFLKFCIENLGFQVLLPSKPLSYMKKACIDLENFADFNDIG